MEKLVPSSASTPAAGTMADIAPPAAVGAGAAAAPLPSGPPHALLRRIFELTPPSLSVLLVCKDWHAAALDTPAWWQELLRRPCVWGYARVDSYETGPGAHRIFFTRDPEVAVAKDGGAALLFFLARVGAHCRTLWADPRQVAPLSLPRLLGAARTACPRLESLSANLDFPESRGHKTAEDAVQARGATEHAVPGCGRSGEALGMGGAQGRAAGTHPITAPTPKRTAPHLACWHPNPGAGCGQAVDAHPPAPGAWPRAARRGRAASRRLRLGPAARPAAGPHRAARPRHQPRAISPGAWAPRAWAAACWAA